MLIGLSLVLMKLQIKSHLSILLDSFTSPLLSITMGSLFIFGCFRIINSDMSGADCDCDVCDTSSSSLKMIFQYSLFLVPIILALVIGA
ncbi:DUF1980 domain-containing protein [Bacillus sp. V2I10]|uniref:DUF1980 domain-containing protein n=1 Tax=Bacillus sp. V2I10 TaxID=3042276 RepID=UPI0035939876